MKRFVSDILDAYARMGLSVQRMGRSKYPPSKPTMATRALRARVRRLETYNTVELLKRVERLSSHSPVYDSWRK